MATYLTGVSDFIPQIQPYKPDLNFYSDVMQTMQGRYDSNYEQLSQYYGKLLKSPLTREDNIERRNTFFKAIDQDIKKISGLDLSLQQNVDQAVKILDPLVNDKYIVNDMVWTKHKDMSLAKGQFLKDTPHGWDGGNQIINYMTDEFRKVAPDDALNMPRPDYIQYVNLEKLAMEDILANKFEVKRDSSKGGFIVTNKNGDLLAGNLRDYLVGRFGQDPKVMTFMRGQSYLKRKNWIFENLHQYGGNEKAAQTGYAQMHLDRSIKNIKATKMEADYQKKVINDYNELYKEFITENGVLPTDKATLDKIAAARQAQANATQSADVINKQNEEVNLYLRDYFDTVNDGGKLDSILAYNDIYTEYDKIAKQYAYMTSEQTIKMADPYVLENVHQGNRIALEQIRHQHNMEEEEFKATIKLQADLKVKGLHVTDMTTYQDAPGSSTGPGGANVLKDGIAQNNQFYYEVSSGKSALLHEYARTLIAKYSDSKSSPTERDNVRDVLEETFVPLGISVDKLLDNRTSQEALTAIKNMQSATNPQLFRTFEAAMKKLDDPAVAASWGNGFKDRYAQSLNNISVQENALNAYRAERIDEVKNKILPKFRDPANDPTGMIAAVMDESTNGFWPNSAINKRNVINKIANNNPGSIFTVEYLNQHWDEARKIFEQSYIDNPDIQLSNHIDGMGRQSNALTTGAVGGNFDYGDASPQSTTRIFESVIQDVKRAYGRPEDVADGVKSGMLRVGYGDTGGMLENSDPQATAELEAMLAGRSANAKFKGSWRYQNIGGGNPNYAKILITPSQEYVDSFKSTEKQPGPISGRSIEVLIPKSELQNTIFRDSQTTSIEYAYDKTGSVNVQNQSGTVNIVPGINGPEAHAQFSVFDPATGQNIKREFTMDYDISKDINGIYNEWNSKLAALDQWNRMQKAAVANDRGIKDIREIDNLMRSNGR
jgi:hypothetical protein